MKKNYSILILFFYSLFAVAQTVCNPSGNLMVFTNYDGGNLNIDVDVNIPNLKIGVVSYEGTAITISGTFAGNVTSVAYDGFNSTNPHCGGSISTSISGAGSATTNIAFAPTATLSNSFGYGSIICGYSCSTTTNQGGCNTVDQIEDYFLNYFPGSQLYAHKVQYGCWTGNQSLSAGGTCCALATGIASDVSQKNLSIFPNPASATLTITFNKFVSNGTVRVFSTAGELVKQESNISGTDHSVAVSGLSAGIYFIETNDGEEISHLRFIKN
jgi:hypothetical protein